MSYLFRITFTGANVQTLVTAAGIVENYVAHDYPTEKIRKLLDINVMGTWFCALEAAKLMPEGGSIVMIGSMSGSVSDPRIVREGLANVTGRECSPAADAIQLLQGSCPTHGTIARCRVGSQQDPSQLYLSRIRPHQLDQGYVPHTLS
jgi:hypothetical protein